MIDTVTSIIRIEFAYVPKIITAKTVTCIHNGETIIWPAWWFDVNAPVKPATN